MSKSWSRTTNNGVAFRMLKHQLAHKAYLLDHAGSPGTKVLNSNVEDYEEVQEGKDDRIL